MHWYLKVLRQYFDFTGRARRSEYSYLILLLPILGWLWLLILLFTDSERKDNKWGPSPKQTKWRSRCTQLSSRHHPLGHVLRLWSYRRPPLLGPFDPPMNHH